ncbi:hypothetical protein H2204_003505 [Knufia peltigerae]|uniref:FAS1 domain-containing protein n=1 Tax=Knufia peltigerae TaxID=1002370 RepID=A0AA39CZD4_9EURO|nr:hypothetical protein H2204_003505 [Knufia peltigerae]
MFRKIGALSALATATAAAIGTQEGQALPTLVDLVNQTHGFSYLNTYLEMFPEVRDSVASLTNITVLAPSDTAIWKFIETPRYAELEEGGADYLQALLSYHILNGVHDNISEYGPLTTLLSSPKYTNTTAGQVVFAYYNDHGFEVAIASGNDSVAGTLGGKPIPFQGGVVYPINDVLTIPGPLSKEVSGSFNGTSFVNALDKSGLTGEINDLKDATFFVPKNAGFESVSQSLSALSPEALAAVLKYHVVPDFLGYYDSLENGTTLTTLQGQKLTIFVNEAEEMFVNGAGVNIVNIPVANGIAIVIDNVLNPEATVKPPTKDAEDGVAAFPTGQGAGTSEGITSTTTEAAAATYTGAANPLSIGAISLYTLVGAAMFTIAL